MGKLGLRRAKGGLSMQEVTGDIWTIDKLSSTRE